MRAVGGVEFVGDRAGSGRSVFPVPTSHFMHPRLGLIAAFLAVAVVAGAYYVGVKGEGRSAINRWRPVVRELWAGVDIYQVRAFPTPPIMAILLTPFCSLDGKGAMTAWFVFKVACATLAIVWTMGFVGRRPGAVGLKRETSTGNRELSQARQEPKDVSTVAGMVGLVLAVRPILGDLQHGNVNLWILFLVVASIVAFRAGRDVVAGWLLSLAVACKLTPALVVMYFAWKREWKIVVSSVVGLVVWFLLVPASFLGWQRNLALLDHWAEVMVWPYVAQGQVDTEQVNQSAPALLHRLLTDRTAIEADDGESEVRIALATLDPTAVHFLWKLLAGSLLIGLAWICRKQLWDRTDPRWMHELGLVFLAMLLFSERSWKHHFVWLLPIGVVLAAAAVELWRAKQAVAAGAIWGLLAAAFLFMLATSPDAMEPLLGFRAAKYIQAWGAYVWAAFALASAHWVALATSPVGEAGRERAPRPSIAEG